MRGVSAKIALAAGIAAGGIGLFWVPVDGQSWTYAIIAALILGLGAFVVTYLVARRQVTDRLARVERVLTELRSTAGRSAGSIGSDGQGGDGGDEIDRLLRRADQAHHAATRRIEELSRADHFRRDYVGDVSHEIKTPIFAIQGFAETLLGGALDDSSVNRGFVEKILHNANRLSALARDLGEISRLETGMIKLSPRPFDVWRVYEEVRDSLDHVAQAADVDIRIGGARGAGDGGDGARQVYGDRERIRQVITNLVDNAIKYGKPGGCVELGAERLHDAVRLYVRDDGIGIGPEELPRVTERFYRADKSRSRGQGGTGLGLSIVKHILAAHRADLKIESEPGVGSTFSLILPTSGPEEGTAL